MRNVNISRSQLLEIVRKNRAAHREIFLEAQKGYREAAITVLDKMLADARDGRKINQTIGLVAPVDRTPDYDRVIRMLELSLDDEITLEEYEFQQYVLDQWAWKQQFLAANATYSNVANQAFQQMDTDAVGGQLLDGTNFMQQVSNGKGLL